MAPKDEDEKYADEDAPGDDEEDAGVKTMTVPSTVVLKFRNPRTVTVGSETSLLSLFLLDSETFPSFPDELKVEGTSSTSTSASFRSWWYLSPLSGSVSRDPIIS